MKLHRTYKRMYKMAMKHLGSGGLGSEFKITKEEGDGVYNPATGELEKGEVKEIITSAVRMSVKQYLVDNDIVLSDDVHFYVAPEDNKGCLVDYPSPTDTVEFDNKKYVIKDVKPWDFSGMLIGYKIHARVAS